MERSSFSNALNTVDLPTFFTAGHGHRYAFSNGPAGLKAGNQLVKDPEGPVYGPGLLIRSKAELFFRELQAGLEAGRKFHQRLPHRLKLPGHAAEDLPDRSSGLVQRHGADQVVHGLGLDHVQSPVQVGPQGVFARPGRPGPGMDAQPDYLFEDGRAAMAAQFDDVFAGVGVWGLEIGQEAFVDHFSGLGVADLAKDEPADGEAVMPALPRQEDLPDYVRGVTAAEPDDAEAPGPGGSGNGDYRIFQHFEDLLQALILEENRGDHKRGGPLRSPGTGH